MILKLKLLKIKNNTMRNNILDKFAIDFINNHFDEIDLKKLDWNISNKEQVIKEIKKKDYLAGWIITDVMRWGTSKDYQKDYLVENDDEHFIVKINKRYFALDYDNENYFNEVKARKVIIEKLVFDKLK